MYCTRKITDDITWIGANDRRLAMFEGVYSVPDGVSYNSYLLNDDKTVLFDTVDKAVGAVFFENLSRALEGRPLDYVIVQHMEPDHTATLAELLLRHPETVVVGSAMCLDMLEQFYAPKLPKERVRTVKNGDTLETGRHSLSFFSAPMVHWPEVIVTYDATEGILFSADAFGTFGALNGALFADEVDFMGEYLAEARRYYANIVGKYGQQVQALLRKLTTARVNMICPLHGFVWRKNIGDYIEKYDKWSRYEPEAQGVMIAYASVYGHTENAAEILACRLRERGVVTAMYDVSVKPASEVVSAAFRYSHLVFASTTYNAGVFVRMDETLRDLAAHNIQNRVVAFIENGSWAPTSGAGMRKILSGCKDLTFIEKTVTLRSALKREQLSDIDSMCEALAQTLPQPAASPAQERLESDANVDPKALFALAYGLFIVTAKNGQKDNGCITNTCIQVSNKPDRVSIAVNKANLTHDMISASGLFNVSILTEDAPFAVFERFGFHSGRDADKFANDTSNPRSENGLIYLPQYSNAFISGKVVQTVDCGSHTLFIADIVESAVLSAAPSVTYAYYFAHIKPKPQKSAPAQKKRWVCKICGYVYEGDELPADFVCPICKHPASDFELMPAQPEKPKGWVCSICGYVYEGETLPPDFICPLCKHPASDFVRET